MSTTTAQEEAIIFLRNLNPEAYAAAKAVAEGREARTIHKLRQLVEEHRVDLLSTYIGHSGGKDSVCIAHLMHRAFPTHEFLLVHTPKVGVTHPATVEFLYQLPQPLLLCPAGQHDRLGFKAQVDGTRAAEYDRTDGRSTDVVVDGRNVSRRDMPMFVAKGLFDLQFIYPIVDWSDEEVWSYIFFRNIPFSAEYLE